MVKRIVLVAVLAVTFNLSALGQGIDADAFNGSFMASLDGANDKIVQLAMAFDEDKYDWRPSEGIRSVSEALMHVASANAFFASSLGAEVPKSLQGRNLEKEVTTKEEAIKVLKESIKASRAAVEALSASQMTDEIDWFDGSKKPKMAMVMVVNDHAQEHLGQLIAYARSTGTVPPWSN